MIGTNIEKEEYLTKKKNYDQLQFFEVEQTKFID